MKKKYSETLIALSVAFLTATTGITAAHANILASEDYSAASAESIEKATFIEPLENKSHPAVTADPKAHISFEKVALATPKPSPEELEARRLAEEKKAQEEAARIAQEEADKKAKADAEAAEVARVAKEKADAEAAAKKAEEDAKAKAELEASILAQEQTQNVAPAVGSTGLVQVGNGSNPSSSNTPAPGNAPVSEPKANLANNPNAYQRYAGEELARRGMGSASELNCLITIWDRESGWNPNAANPTSTARGIPQKMMNIHHGPGWKTDPAALEYLSNPEVQINWGIDYIQGRYGSPCGAMTFWNANHWY